VRPDYHWVISPHPKSFSKGEGLELRPFLSPLLWRGLGEAK